MNRYILILSCLLQAVAVAAESPTKNDSTSVSISDPYALEKLCSNVYAIDHKTQKRKPEPLSPKSLLPDHVYFRYDSRSRRHVLVATNEKGQIDPSPLAPGVVLKCDQVDMPPPEPGEVSSSSDYCYLSPDKDKLFVRLSKDDAGKISESPHHKEGIFRMLEAWQSNGPSWQIINATPERPKDVSKAISELEIETIEVKPTTGTQTGQTAEQANTVQNKPQEQTTTPPPRPKMPGYPGSDTDVPLSIGGNWYQFPKHTATHVWIMYKDKDRATVYWLPKAGQVIRFSGVLGRKQELVTFVLRASSTQVDPFQKLYWVEEKVAKKFEDQGQPYCPT